MISSFVFFFFFFFFQAEDGIRDHCVTGVQTCALPLLLMGAMVLLAPLAYASPPEPGWIAGFWDNGDYDDVVLLATSSVGTTDALLPCHTMSAAVVIASVSSPVESLLSASRLSSWPT